MDRSRIKTLSLNLGVYSYGVVVLTILGGLQINYSSIISMTLTVFMIWCIEKCDPDFLR